MLHEDDIKTLSLVELRAQLMEAVEVQEDAYFADQVFDELVRRMEEGCSDGRQAEIIQYLRASLERQKTEAEEAEPRIHKRVEEWHRVRMETLAANIESVKRELEAVKEACRPFAPKVGSPRSGSAADYVAWVLDYVLRGCPQPPPVI